MPKLLVVDDEPVICQSFTWVFSSPDVEVVTAGTLADGWRKVEECRPDVVVLDYQLPDGSGIDLFDRIRAADPRLPVIFLTAHGTTDTAIETMKRGAFDYLAKPFDLEQMSGLLERAFEAARLVREPGGPAAEVRADLIVGRSPALREISKQIGRVAPLDVTVLILGESGTGKELVARAIYQHSRRADKPFHVINCAAIPEGLVESELFGHERGAFTGAGRRQIGRFEQANGGTLFLDEIGDMPLAVQAKVLRLLQDQTFERVGGRESISTRVRVLAATNHDLENLIAGGRFRNDLYYRLKEVTLRLPPLRDRLEDLPDLAHHLLAQFVRETGRDVSGFDPDVLEMFQRYSWPGNIRELRGVIKEAVLKTTGRVILPEFLPPGFTSQTGEPSAPPAPNGAERPVEFDLAGNIEAMLQAGEKGMYARVVGEVERELITRVLRHTRGHQGQACTQLGIDRKTLRNKLRDLGITLDKVVTDRADPSDD
ncbi:sigma-54-dependent transcriptional regulator [Fimbriiglobus ruber]|uniref:DNA-binding transcriptional regulator NtrC n=1 Tax=Fimbriiglobus ruber TaxID=1908690 RepID=A0A225DQ07_9BACT|nr:sigma-54 dependent transcriptional regulator [Fimbriiglobus ruber]OWK41684.1 Response regulator of zinc sigma-54-dependent two-component system [Fimbriiglobus ruber]